MYIVAIVQNYIFSYLGINSLSHAKPEQQNFSTILQFDSFLGRFWHVNFWKLTLQIQLVLSLKGLQYIDV